MLLWFAPGCISTSARACVIDPHQPCVIGPLQVREIYLDPCAVPGLWWHTTPMQQAENDTRTDIDQMIRSSFSKCAAGSTSIGPNREGLAALLGLPGTGGPAVPSPAEPAEDTAAGPAPDPLVQQRDEVPPVTEPGRDQSADGGSGVGQPPPAVATPPPVTERVAEAIPVITPEKKETPAAVAVPPAHVPAEMPRAVIGWSSLSTRWTAVGRLSAGNELVALDLDHPKAVGIFGYMGSGKSYLLGTVIESALAPIPGVNSLPAPLAVVIFNYRRNASDRFELNSFAFPNQDATDAERLTTEYHARPAPVPDVHILCLPGELRPARLQEYNPLRATELFFDPQSLDVRGLGIADGRAR